MNLVKCDCCGKMVDCLHAVDGGPAYNTLWVCEQCEVELTFSPGLPEYDAGAPTDYASVTSGY